MDDSQPRWGSTSLPYDDVKQIWLRFSQVKPDYGDSAYPPFVFEPTYLELHPDYNSTIGETLSDLAIELAQCVENPQNHIQRLNHVMASKILCTFDRTVPQTVDKAFDLLQRIPRYPLCLPLDQITDSGPELMQQALREGYLAMDHHQEAVTSEPTLKVDEVIDGCTMRLALASAEAPTHSLCFAIKTFLNVIAKLLDIAIATLFENSPGFIPGAVVTIRYLWAMWHRSATLYLSTLLNIATWINSDEMGDMLALSLPSLLGRPAIQLSWRGIPGERSTYMCTWAWELLGASRGSLAFDFRLFHSRFKEAFSNAHPRCTLANQTCSGDSPESCGRFNCEELVKGDQSLHDAGCRGCKRLIWDRKSYLKLQGGRAVDISRRSSSIKFCNAGPDTIAISHVWSHGQGGRPDTGINECLHARYVKMAKENKCSSYWIDTMCIPDDHNLRKEAIHYINDTFSQSKMTLVCDRDLATLTAPSGDTPNDVIRAERLLVTLLVCDWNVRAWTLLEAVRGGHNLHIVCADNILASVRAIVQLILQKGSLDIAALALAAQHLREKSDVKFKVMDASAMLSHRYATRPGDDVVIWSLMCAIPQDDISDNPKGFWKSKIGYFINTGYLMSTAPRLQGVKGFHWAPRTPNVRSSDPLLPNAYSSDGSGSEVGKVMKDGLEAIWLCYQVEDWHSHYYGGEIKGSLINKCWIEAQWLRALHARVCLLMAKSQSVGRHFAAEDSGKDYSLVAVVFSDSKTAKYGNTYEDEWTWSGTHVWPSSIPLPPMDWEKILLT